MPFADPEKAREAKRKSAERRRRSKGSTPRRPRVDPMIRPPETMAPREVVAPLPVQPILDHREQAESMMDLFPGTRWWMVYQEVMPDGTLGKRKAEKAREWKEDSTRTLQHHAVGHLLAYGHPRYGDRTAWGATGPMSLGSARAILETLATVHQRGYLFEGWEPGTYWVFLWFFNSTCAGSVRRLLEWAGGKASTTYALAYPSKKPRPGELTGRNFQLGVPLPFCGNRCRAIDPSTEQPIRLQEIISGLERNPSPPAKRHLERLWSEAKEKSCPKV